MNKALKREQQAEQKPVINTRLDVAVSSLQAYKNDLAVTNFNIS